MVRQLESDYELETRIIHYGTFVSDAFSIIGGVKGFIAISVGILLFFYAVDYTMAASRRSRESKKRKKH